MGRAIRQTRQTQRGQYNSSSIANGLGFKLRRKKATSQYNTITMTANWRIGRGIRKRRDSSGNLKKTAHFVEMTKNWKAEKLEDIQYTATVAEDYD